MRKDWVLTSSRLPEDNHAVLFFDNERKMYTGVFKKEEGCFMDTDFFCSRKDEVTHWMPLPEKPEGY